jgi:hypothetical protein
VRWELGKGVIPAFEAVDKDQKKGVSLSHDDYQPETD